MTGEKGNHIFYRVGLTLQIFLYGGYSKEVSSDKNSSEKGIVHSDLWSLDPRTWEWSKVREFSAFFIYPVHTRCVLIAPFISMFFCSVIFHVKIWLLCFVCWIEVWCMQRTLCSYLHLSECSMFVSWLLSVICINST